MKKGDRSGWSLIEIAIVVTIIGLLAALAIPMFSILTKRSRLSSLANDLRTHGQAIQSYALQEGDFPTDFASPTIPLYDDGQPVVGPTWKLPSPVGGTYSWNFVDPGNSTNSRGYIEIVETAASPFSVDLSDIEKFDTRMDDGNLSTGYLQMAGGRIRYYLKLPNP